MEDSIQIPLNLPNMRLLKISQMEKGEWRIKVEIKVNSKNRRKCGEEIQQLYGHDKAVRLRHLPLFEVPVYIELRSKRYRYPKCEGGPSTSQSLSCYEQRSPNTKACVNWLLKMFINSTASTEAGVARLGVLKDRK